MATAKKATKASAKKARRAPPPPMEDAETEVGEGFGSYNYFADMAAKEGIQFVSTGCAVLDCVLGGGWALGRIANVVGDKSTGKTLLAMESMANFAVSDPKGWLRYAEAEHAFDEPYAAALGMPMDRIEFNQDAAPLATVEEVYDDLLSCIEKRKKNQSGIFILDSLDAISDEAEQKRDFGESTMGMAKPKLLSELFRRKSGAIKLSNTLFMIVSQVRQNIGAMHGPTKKRSGGDALDFYASQVLWLAQLEQIKKTVQGIERVIGVKIRAKCTKNKVGLPLRSCDYPVMFGYGIDDLTANVEWLLSVGRDELLRKQFDMTKSGYKTRIAALRGRGGSEVHEMRTALDKAVREEWAKVETQFLPTATKYGARS